VELFTDWVETQALLLGEALTKPELVDRLEGSGLVLDSDDAWRLVGDAFTAAKGRRRSLGASYPFAIAGECIEVGDPRQTAYIFCLMASIPEQIDVLRKGYDQRFRDIFEEIVVEALKGLMPQWAVYSTGWAASARHGKGQIVERIADWSRAKIIDLDIFADANDGQVDVALVRGLPDRRSSFPVILGQCTTSVRDWKNKAIRPNLDKWTMAIQFPCLPGKLFAVPFAFDDSSFLEAASESRGFVLDRIRVCGAVTELGEDLTRRAQDWIEGAFKQLPLAA
jgi:hypothetical protein